MHGRSHVKALLISAILASTLSFQAAPYPAPHSKLTDRRQARGPILCVEQSAASDANEGWRFLRTPHPRGGADAVSITHTPDTLRSDPDLAGLMFRCGEHEVEALIILVRAFPPRTKLRVALGERGKEKQLEATVAPPGAALLLPPESIVLANTAWRALPELSIVIEYDQSAILGVVPLTGLPAALAQLAAACNQ